MIAEESGHSWLDRIEQKAARSSIVFLQLGVAQAETREYLVASGLPFVSVAEYPKEDPRPASEGDRMLVIDKVETLARSSTPPVSMGILRERVFSDVARGLRILLLSTAPRASFPDVPGSSLLDDAVFAQGVFAPVSQFRDLPACSGISSGEVLRRALEELGQEVCASLDRSIWEDSLIGDEALTALKSREMEALEAAGLVYELGGSQHWRFPAHLGELREALADVISRAVSPQTQLPEVTGGLWQIERMLRAAVRDRAVEKWGPKWRKSLLNKELAARVLERALVACPGVRSVAELRDPLEWLSLAELLELKGNPAVGDLGLPAAQWRLFVHDIMPVRNRVAHMRPLHPDDHILVARWRNVMRKRLSLRI